MNLIIVFLVGGAICATGQILIDFTKLTPARILVLFVCAGALLTAVGVYEPLVKFAGAGATVPITGFGYVLARGAMSATATGGIVGALGGGLAATAPGISTAVLCGFLTALAFRPSDK